MTPDATHAAVLRRWILEGRLWASERAAIERAIEKLTELSQCSSCGSYERIVRQP